MSGMVSSYLLFPMANALCLAPWVLLAVERLAAGTGPVWCGCHLSGHFSRTKTADVVVPIDFSIQNGDFANEWLSENLIGRPRFNALERRDAEHPVEEVGKRLRGMMSWIDTEF